MDIIIKLENEYKHKIIFIESLGNKSNQSKNNNIKKNYIYESPIVPYFFKWKENSCRFDSILFIIKFRLKDLFIKYQYNQNNSNLKNLYDLCIELENLKIKDFKLGFFHTYIHLKKDYLNIKSNIDKLKHYDTISSACFMFNDIDELISKYNLTEYCLKCHPFGNTRQMRQPLIFTFDNNDLVNSISKEDLVKGKFNYNNVHCPKCDYIKEGKALNTFNLISIVSNIYIPNILFFCIEDINYEELKKMKVKLNLIFNNEIKIMGNIYELIAIVYMPTFNHFTAAIFNYNGEYYYGMEKGHNYFYDGLNEDGKILEINELVSNQLNNYVKHLYIYSKK